MKVIIRETQTHNAKLSTTSSYKAIISENSETVKVSFPQK